MKAKIFSHLVRPLHPPRVFPWRHNWKSLHLKQLLFSFVCSSLLFSSLLSSFPSAKSAFSINLHFQPPLFLCSLSLQFKSSPWALWDSSLHIYCAAVWYSCKLFLSARHWSSAPVCSRGYRTRSHFHKGRWQGFSPALIGPVLGSLASSTLIDHFVFPQDSVTPSSYQAPCTSPCPDLLWERREWGWEWNGADILIVFSFSAAARR